jgi:hypothetical protein
MQFGRSGSIFYSTDQAIAVFGNNYCQTGATSFTYLGTGFASRYTQSDFNGSHTWYTAPSGTAGNAITFTQAMTLDASGNLVVGGTSALVSASGRGNITVNGSTDSILAFGSAGTNTGYLYATTSGMELASIGSTFVRFSTNGSERARIDSSGNLLVGLTSATGVAKLQVSGPIRTTGYTVATLPAGTVGMRTYVTDALAPSFGVTVSGGGAVTIPVFYNGANWIVA